MIISRFNKYVEKHGRVTYIILGIIICFAFVIFVTPSHNSSGCGAPGRLTSVGKMYGKKISLESFMKLRRETDIACLLRYNMFLSQYNETMLNQETFTRMRMIHEAGKRGYLKQITDAEVAQTIQTLPWLLDDKGTFNLEKFEGFKQNFLRSNQMTAGDFDELIRNNLAIDKMLKDVTKDATVTDEEINAELAEYNLNYAELMLDTNGASKPSAEEVQKFFANRKNEIPVEKQRQALVATLDTAKLIQLAASKEAPATLKKAIAVTPKEIQNQYNTSKTTLYKGKTLEQAKPVIESNLRKNKVRTYAREQVSKLAKELQTATAKLNATDKLAKFQEQTKQAGLSLITTEFFGEATTLAAFKGERRVLTNSIRELQTVGDITPQLIFNGNDYSLAALVAIKDGVLPEKLDEATTTKIEEILINEKAVLFYNEKIAPFKAEAPSTRSAWDLGRKQLEAIQTNESLSDEAKQLELQKFSEFMRETIYPFYRAEERSFQIAAFAYASYEKEVKLTETDFEKGFEARKAEYGKVEVRLSQILIKSAATDKEADKAAKKAKANDIFAKLTAGSDFAKLAKEFSEDEATKEKGGDTGLVNITTLDKTLQEQVAKMAVNQLTPVLTTEQGYAIVKLVEKKGPRSLADVRAELKPILTREAAQKLALADAEKLAQQLEIAWNESGHKEDQKFAIFKKNATSSTAAITDYPLTASNNYGNQGAISDNALMNAVFACTAAEPFTKAVEGTEAAYVACLNKSQAAAIYEAKEKRSLLVNTYKRNVADAALKAKAEALTATINAELKKGTELDKASKETTFKQATDKFTKRNASLFKDFLLRNSQNMAADLAKAETNQLIPPQRSYAGYTLVYLKGKNIPTGEAVQEERKQISEQLKQQKTYTLINRFMTQAEKASNTQNIHPSLLGQHNH